MRKCKRERMGSGACCGPGMGASGPGERKGERGQASVKDIGMNRGWRGIADRNQAGRGSTAAGLHRRGETGWGRGMSSAAGGLDLLGLGSDWAAVPLLEPDEPVDRALEVIV